MSVTRELLDALKATDGGLSDYRIKSIIGVSQSMMTNYNKGTDRLAPEKVLFICDLLGLDPAEWLVRLYRERAKCDSERHVLDDLLNRMAA